MIIDGGHQVVYQAPYWAVDGAIEYVFNTVHTLIEVLFNQIQNIEDLILAVDHVISTLYSSCSYFDRLVLCTAPILGLVVLLDFALVDIAPLVSLWFRLL